MKVLATDEASDQYEKLPTLVKVRGLTVFERPRRWPQVSGAKPLSGRLAGRYRIRTGDYRVQFRLEGDALVVEKVGHRDRFYEGGR